MIRTRTKIYGEVNDPNTVEMATNTNSRSWVTSSGNKSITKIPAQTRRLLITDGDGNVATLNLTGQTNKVIGTDELGNIVLIDRSLL